MLQGINLNNVKNLNLGLERTVRRVSTKLKIPEATLRQSLTLYDGVTDYLAATDLFGTSLIDVRPQGTTRGRDDFAYKQAGDNFDRGKATLPTGYRAALEYDKGTGILRVVSSLPSPKLELDPLTATTGWTAAGSAGSLAADSTVYWQAPSALRFTLTGSSTGTLTKTISRQDFTYYKNVGVAFLAIRIPAATNLTSITLKLGSSASAYYSVTATTGFIKAFTAGDWMLVAFDFSTAAVTGTPTDTSLTYAQISIAHTGTITNFYVGDLWIALPSPSTLIYRTAALFIPQGSTAPQSTITNDNDTVMLNDAALIILEYEAALTIGSQSGGTIASGLLADFKQELNGLRAPRTGVMIQAGLYDLYRSDNPSQDLKEVGNWYDD